MPGGGLEFACEKPKERPAEDPDHVMKTLQSLESTDEKLSVICKKYNELMDEHKSTQAQFKQSQRALSVLSREKDQLQSEHSKAVLAKSKLEGLCRELQRHNKLVKDESIARAKEDDEKRKEVTGKFQTTINDIQQQMNDHYQKNTSLREENMELANKLKGLIEQYELREQQIEKIMKSKELEAQLYDARLQQAALQIGEEKEKHLHDSQLLLRDSMESQKKIMLLEEQEKALKAQVAMYSEKYDDFQSTLTKSNDVFNTFKTEMDKMSKKIKKLEKETLMWRQKWEASQKSQLEMAEQKTRSDKDMSLLQNKLSKLEGLCRALQEERKRSFNTATTSVGDTVTKNDSSEVTLSSGDSVSEVPTSLSSSEPSSVPIPTQTSDKGASSSDTSSNASSAGATASEVVESRVCDKNVKIDDASSAAAVETCSAPSVDLHSSGAVESVDLAAASQTTEALDTDHNIDDNSLDAANKAV
jgi:DNA repair exonuclease SbcCD ATPase subunit